MIQRRTWILLVGALLSGGAIFWLQKQPPPPASEALGKEKLFTFSRDAVQRIHLQTEDQDLLFVKSDREVNPWDMKGPRERPANDAAIAFLLDRLTQSAIQERFPLGATPVQAGAKPNPYGLSPPTVDLEIGLQDQTQHRLRLGGNNFNHQSIYGQKDNESEILLLPLDLQYATHRTTKEWQAP